jgi:hypothetical protein
MCLWSVPQPPTTFRFGSPRRLRKIPGRIAVVQLLGTASFYRPAEASRARHVGRDDDVRRVRSE